LLALFAIMRYKLPLSSGEELLFLILKKLI